MDELYCEWCNGRGYVYTDAGGREMCPECEWRGTQRCCEGRCPEVAVRVFRERDQTYPLCATHYREWCADAEVPEETLP